MHLYGFIKIIDCFFTKSLQMKQLILCFLLFCYSFCNVTAQIKNPRGINYNWKTDVNIKNIDLSEITAVAPRKTFPAIDYPDFIYKDEALKKFYNHEPVIAININNEAKAYPLNMLTMHEISNDSLGGVPILPTYCPLCNSSIVYDRRLNYRGENYLLNFEVSGMLRNSDMIMADNITETWWQQLTGTGLVGKLAGAELTIIPSMVISVNDFFERFPEGKILSPNMETSAKKNYGKNPYIGYDRKNNLPYASFFNLKKIDSRLAPMERIISVEGKSGYKLYPFSAISKKGIINDSYDGKNIVLFYRKKTVSVLDKSNIRGSKLIGSATVFLSNLEGEQLEFKKKKETFIDLQTKSIWDITGKCIEGVHKNKQLVPVIHSNHFAFAWLAFHPESIIYKN